ncbi:hypothetical protein OX283_009990 [Flavobacterium sp. SUN052]|uniref:hypothetical protein n=1 Tax=Flavobacterium sp. SUN052 TaxID=3002441 RepID=UPI00237DAA24|nr:hypothetical protein [Flavobacterium sp. SUN052]MEC4004987.1 hypothetical protein [Flavobacterium sp. SUN052]
MKKITLLVASVLLFGNFAKASETMKIADERFVTRYSCDEPISFTERGIEFFVFTNGDFDFNTRPDDSQGDYQYKKAGRRSTEADRRNGAPENYGVLIEHDSFGRVRRVGNTFINYDNQDRVSRIGSVYMRYNRFALIQVGGLQIVYNRRGEIVDIFGQVKGRRNGFTNSNYGSNGGYANNNYDDDNYHNTSTYNNNDYYYYKSDGTRAKVEENKKEDNK